MIMEKIFSRNQKLNVIKVGDYFNLFCLSFLAALFVLISTSKYGLGVTSDSVSYLSTARSLMKGKGYFEFDGNAYVWFSPLYPTILAAMGFMGMDIMRGALYLNVLSFTLIIFFSGVIFLKNLAKGGTQASLVFKV